MDVSTGFEAKAPAPIVVTFGNDKERIRVFLKASLAIVISVLGKDTEVRLVQFKNRPLGRVVIGPRIVTEVRAGQLLKIEGPRAKRPL